MSSAVARGRRPRFRVCHSERMARQRIIITGASSGLGAEMARRFAAMGRDLGLCARRLDRLEDLRDQLRAEGARGEIAIRGLDVGDHPSVAKIFGELRDDLGGLDRVIVNAGLGKGAPIGTGRADANLETIHTNLMGGLSQIEAALEHFRAAGSGHLVLVSSISADRGLPGALAAYSASKAGMSALGEGLSAELAGSGITVTTLLPGFIATEMSERAGARSAATLADGVDAMMAAIEAERTRVPLPGLRWRITDLALRYLPLGVTARMVPRH